MAQVVWTPDARRDLREIHNFIARDSPNRAGATLKRIASSVSRLERFPESGRLVPELAGRIDRELIIGNYRVIYRYARDTNTVGVLALAVVHGRRRLPPIPD